MVNQPPPYDPNYGQQPPQQQPGQQQPAPGPYGPPQPGGQLPPPAYPMPQAGFTSPPNLGPARKPGGVGGLTAMLFVVAGLQLVDVIIGLISLLDYWHASIEAHTAQLAWIVGMGFDVVKVAGLVLAGVMVAGGKDAGRILGAFVAGAALQGGFGVAVAQIGYLIDYEISLSLSGVLTIVVGLLTAGAAIVVLVMAVGRPVSRWFAEKVLARTS